MRSASTLTSKGQLTVPNEVRIRLGVRHGDQVEFVRGGGAVVVRPVRQGSPFGKYVNAPGGSPGGREENNAGVTPLRDE
jgi:AbrB family looped-hinge helix DNA binding protein